MKNLFKIMGIAAAAGAVLGSVPASAEYQDGKVTRVVISGDGTITV